MISDTPRKLLDKEIAGEFAICPKTLARWKREGLRLPPWPRTLAESVAAVNEWRRRTLPRPSAPK